MQLIKGVKKEAVKLVLFGPEGIGKSTFASNFPRPVFIDTEGSTAHMDVTRTPKPLSWAELTLQVKYFVENPSELATLIIDTADWAERLCIEQICAQRKMASIEDAGYGRGYVYLAEEFGRILDLLEDLRKKGVHIVLTAHAAMRKFEQPDEIGSYDRWELKLQKKTAPMVKEWADMLLFANYRTYVITTSENKKKAQGGERIMYTTHHPCWDAKNRFGLPEEMPFDFKGIAHLFPGAPVTGNPITPPRAPEPPKTTSVTAPPVDPAPSQVAPTPPADAPAHYDGVPPELEQLMRTNDVTPEEIVYIVAQRGYYPANTPIANYDPDFVKGVLIAAWDKVLVMIQKSRTETPF